MIIENIVFNIFAIALFINILIKIIRTKDKIYIGILIAQIIGMIFGLISLILGEKTNITIISLKYLLAIMLPLAVTIIEIKLKPFNQLMYILFAKYLMHFEKENEAKKLLIEIEEKYPECYDAHQMLGEIYEQTGLIEKAIDEYVYAIDINKQDYESYYRVAKMLKGQNKEDQAKQMLESLLEKKQDMTGASVLLGEILINTGMYKEAANIYEEALKLNPTDFDLNCSLGMVYSLLNDFPSAKMYYEKASELNSMKHVLGYSLAEIALIYKDLEEAEKRFQLASEDEELSADSYFELSKIALIKKDRQKAINYLNLALEIDKKKIHAKMKKDSIFIPIIAKVTIPKNSEMKKKEDEIFKLTKTETKVKEYLESMSDLTRNLSYSDMKFVKKYQNKKQENYEKKEQENKLKEVQKEHNT